MSDYEKGITIVLRPEDGEALWQPKPSTGFIVNKLNPYNSPYDSFSTGLQVLEPGTHIRRHAHERQHEILFCYRGEGYAEIGDTRARHDLAEESMMLIGRGVQHKVVNTGAGQMRLLWIISPPGLEDWFRALGRPKQPGDSQAPVFERPANIEEIQARQRFIRGDD
jgi:mannose-6-phosphate isomerase-like protein (cupin superfamily)